MKLISALISYAAASALTITPKPQSQMDDGNTYALDSSEFDFAVTGESSTILTDAISRTTATIFGQRAFQSELHSLHRLLSSDVITDAEFSKLAAKSTTASTTMPRF